MASIQSKLRKSGKRKYYIVYRFREEDGTRKDIWFPCDSKTEARLLLDDVAAAENENRIFTRNDSKERYASFGSADEITVDELCSMYAEHHTTLGKWEARSRQIALSIIRNYISPYIGSTPISKATTLFLQSYYNDLPNHKMAAGNHTSEPRNITPRIVREVHKILRPAFSLAKKWDLIASNPTFDLELPKSEKYNREQWSAEELLSAIRSCENEELALALTTMFSCTLRTGELLGLQWSNLDISEQSIANGTASISVTQELSRLFREDIERTNTTVYLEFPSSKPKSKTTVILKKPKTESSIRRIYLPSTVARQLSAHKQKQSEWKEEIGDAYHDFNLVFAQDNGMPHANDTIRMQFKKLIASTGHRKVDLYSMRHTGATEKLRATLDLKSTQRDMGHSSTAMLLNTYTAIVDEDRRKNAAIMDQRFFSKTSSDEENGMEKTEKI